MNWTVLSVAYPFAPVSSDSVGGAEQVLAMLDRALTEQGHRSLVIAAEGSRIGGTLLALPPLPAHIDDEVRASTHQTVRELIARTTAAEPVDVIHFHGVDFRAYLPAKRSPPVLATLHLPLPWYPQEIFHLERPAFFLHCVSAAQEATVPEGSDLLPAIPNGVDLEKFRPRGRPQEYAMLLGRICPEKGVAIALRVCRAACLPLLIGGQVYPYVAHQDYFRSEVEPLLDGCRRFLGPLPLDRKAGLLAKAKCLLIPSLAAETSSLVAMEALASGTPVIGFDSGALSSLVEDGITGYVVRDEREMLDRVGRIGQIDRNLCRAHALERFSHHTMIENYFRVYHQLANCELPQHPLPDRAFLH